MNRKTVIRILGIGVGLFLFALLSSMLVVRMTEKSSFCARCHVMKPMYDSYITSSHNYITCNDCHTPHESYLAKVTYKAMAGLWDVYIFFSGQTPQLIETKPRSKKIIMSNCKRCHGELVRAINTEAKECFGCHRNTPHGLRYRDPK